MKMIYRLVVFKVHMIVRAEAWNGLHNTHAHRYAVPAVPCTHLTERMIAGHASGIATEALVQRDLSSSNGLRDTVDPAAL